MWPTPCASDNRDRGRWEDPAIQRRVELGKQVMLSMLAQGSGQVMSLWHTPACHMAREGGYPAEFTRNTPTMTAEAYMALGLKASGSLGQTQKPGALNPEFVCWLMGFPPEWDACAPTAMPSFRKSRRKS